MDTPRTLMKSKEKGKVFENQDWSNLHPDLLRPILESLSCKVFYRAKAVCSDWYSVWKTCERRSLCPWRITYKGYASMLFDPKEDKTKLLGLYCMASYGNWVLVVDSCLNFCILNLLTRKRINLPSMDSSARVGQDAAVLWINEKTGDYVVAWIFRQNQLFSLKKGDGSWWKWNYEGVIWGFYDMAYKNSKLYLYTYDHRIKILDFSGHSPKEEGIEENPYLNYPFTFFEDHLNYPSNFIENLWEYTWKRRIAIRNSGEVLIILSLFIEDIHEERKTLFYIFKMNLESGRWERVDSIGDNEMLIFGHGVTIRAPFQNAGDGIKSDSICFIDEDIWPDSDHPSNCGVFDLATSRITWPYIDKTHWFVPGYGNDLGGEEAGYEAADCRG